MNRPPHRTPPGRVAEAGHGPGDAPATVSPQLGDIPDEHAPGAPRVSILIVTWNRREELVRSLESVRAQSYPNKEIVVVDNASSDGTAAMVQQRFPEATLVLAPRNLGCPSARNLGFRHCTGRYIYMLDDDGWLQDDAVELCVRRAESDSALAVVMARVHVVENGKVVARYPVGADHSVYRADFSGGCSLIRSEALRATGVFPEDYFRQGEEENLALRLLDSGYYCFLEPAAVMYHALSPVGRDLPTFRFYTLRNSNKTALRLWPMPWCTLRLLVNLGHAARYSLATGHWYLPFRLLSSLAQEVWALPRHRRPVARDTFRLFRQLQTAPTPEPPAHPRTCRWRRGAAAPAAKAAPSCGDCNSMELGHGQESGANSQTPRV
jgi:GT2 family glycosyltransferase